MARKSKRLLTKTEEIKTNNNIYNVAVYIRLSVEENRNGKESESLENQQAIIIDYMKNKADMQLYKVYCDNGETGSNFKRDAFQDMMYDIYNGRVNCVIVKDLSRFGREYIEMGDYLEKIFPLIGVRFIAINDHYDNQVSAFDISVPIKNIINTLYAKDISKKQIASRHIKRINGEFIGSYAPYGYLKSPEDRHKLIIDEEAASIVKMIFDWKASGLGDTAICRKLYDMNIVPPGKYRYDKGIILDKRYANCHYWNTYTIKSMLQREVYIGNMVQGKRKSHFYEGLPEERLNKEQWTVVENTHEPIISKELFDEVQNIIGKTKETYLGNLGKYDKMSNDNNLFKHKVICGVCNGFMRRIKLIQKQKQVSYSYICSHHVRFPQLCNAKTIPETTLKDIVMTAIKAQTTCFSDMEKMFLKVVNSKKIKEKQVELTRAISESLSNISYIRMSRIRITTDLSKGVIGDEDYNDLKTEFEAQLRSETEKLDKINKEREMFDKLISVPKWIDGFKKYKNKKILTKEMVDAFVEKIIVYPDKDIQIVWTYECKQNELLSLLKGGDSRD
ncbi:MAG: recombinase family protein [Clostridia bacterium]|nr:recombinase family protein [Clostridia bacterium]